jgi:hypothetical protein
MFGTDAGFSNNESAEVGYLRRTVSSRENMYTSAINPAVEVARPDKTQTSGIL